MSVAGLSGLLGNSQTPLAHAPTHVTGGGDTIANVIAGGNSGLMSGTMLTKLNGIEALADVTDDTNVRAALAAATADIAFNTHKLTGIVDPTNAQEAATKKYVDDTITSNKYWTRDAGNTAIYPTNVGDSVFLPDDVPLEFGGTTAAPDASIRWDDVGNELEINTTTANADIHLDSSTGSVKMGAYSFTAAVAQANPIPCLIMDNRYDNAGVSVNKWVMYTTATQACGMGMSNGYMDFLMPPATYFRWHNGVTNVDGTGAVKRMALINGQLQLPTVGAAAGLLFGGDAHIYRGVGNTLFLGAGDDFRILDDDHLQFGSGPDVSLKWDNANSKFQIDAGSNFIEHVADRLELDHRGTSNIFIGKDCGKDCGAAIRNTGIGDYVFDAGAAFTGDDNVALGYGAGGKITSGQHNTLAGVYAGANITNGLDNVFAGYKAGHYGNPSNTFYLDNRDRANEAGQQQDSLIFGLFGANANAQDIYFNANLHLKHDNIEFYFGAGTDSKIYFNGSALVIETGGVTNTDDIMLTTAAQGQVLLAQSGSAGTPSLAFNSSVALGLYRYNNTTLGVSQNLLVKEDVEVGEFFRVTKTTATIAGNGSITPLSSNIELTSVNNPDDLDTISGGNDEDFIVFQKGTPIINIRDASTGVGGNIHLDGQIDFQLNSVYDRLVLQRHNDDEWVEISRSNNT